MKPAGPSSPLRRAAVLASVVAGFATLVATGGGGGGSPTGQGGNEPPAGCVVGVASGFAGDTEWSSGDGSFGTGADGRYGVGIGAGVSLGAVKGATVTVTRADGTVVGSAPTGADGRATFTSCGLAGPYLVQVGGTAGSTYFDEAKGAEVPFAAGTVLRAYVPTIVANIGVTAFTEAAARSLSGAPAGEGGVTAKGAEAKALPDAAAIGAANERMRALAAALAPEGFAPAEVTRMPALGGTGVPGGSALADLASVRHALLLAGLGRAAALHNPTLAGPGLEAARQLARDAADGVVDGVDAQGLPVAAAGARAYDAPRLGASLAAATGVVARRNADPTVQARTPEVVAMGAFGPPGGGGTATPVRLRGTGVAATVDTAGNDAQQLATDAVELTSASQQPATALFVRRADGSIGAVGFDGANGLRGLNSTAGSTTLVDVAALRGASAVSVGSAHALARMADGTVQGWGDATRGQLGSGATTRTSLPIAGLADVVSVLALGNLSYALRNDGTVSAWGTGGASLGGGTTGAATRTAPAPVLAAASQPLAGVVAIAGYVGTTGTPDATLAALKADGTVWAWGDNASGGLGAPGASQGFAQQVPGLVRIQRVVASGNGFHALDRDGAVWFWGTPTPAAGAAAIAVVPTKLAGLPAIDDLAGAVPGVVQARLLGADGQRWRTDGLNAAPVTPATELSLTPPAEGITTIASVTGDDRVNAAERAAGVTITGTVSQANRPVRVVVGNVTKNTTATGTAWSVALTPAELPTTGTVTVTASFTTNAGAPSGTASRTVTIDAVAPTVSVSAVQSGGGFVFTFDWSEPVTGFTSDDVAISLAGTTRGAFTTVTTSRYTLAVTPPANAVGSLTVTVAPGAVADLAGNPSAAPGTGTVTVSDTTRPTVTIEDDVPGVATGLITFTFTWSEPMPTFTANAVTVVLGNKGTFTKVSDLVYRLVVSPPPTQSGTMTVTVADSAVRDAAGNGNVARSVTQDYDTATLSVDLGSASPGTGEGDGGSAGDAGNPGEPPAAFTVTATTPNASTLTMTWTKHATAVTYYQVLVRAGPTAPLLPLGNRIAATAPRYSVSVPRTPSARTYRIRACNIDGQAVVANADSDNGFWGCTDSREIKVDGTPERPYVQITRTTTNFDPSGFTITFRWNVPVASGFDETDFVVSGMIVDTPFRLNGNNQYVFESNAECTFDFGLGRCAATQGTIQVRANAVPAVDGSSNLASPTLTIPFR